MTPTIQNLLDFYRKEQDQLNAEGLYRQCRVPAPNTLNFSSNDYLGLSQDERIKNAVIAATEEYGFGTGGSRLITGTRDLHVQLEEAVADFKKTEAALVFNSGYQANIGILQALTGPGDWIFCDKLNHASLLDGCLLSGARWSRYHHLDLNHLESKLQKAPTDAKKWLVTDTLFSMDGDWPDLPELVNLSKKYNALIMLDEAHATGVFGDQRSSGLAEHLGVSENIALHMGTFSKSLGGFGAYVAGPRILIDYLINTSRSFIYSTSLPPCVIAGNLQALEIVQKEPIHKQKLWENIQTFSPRLHKILNEKNISAPNILNMRSQIIPILLGEAKHATRISEALSGQGIFVQAVRPPTVPEKTSRLRISLSALHTAADLNQLSEALESSL